jgi:CBS domain-containing protein
MPRQQPDEAAPDISNQRTLEFLRSVPPFDTLGTSELSQMITQMEMVYIPRGERIRSKGDRSFEHLYIIQKGSARISLIDDEGENLLVDIRGEGDYFGATSLLQDKPPMFDISAEQDLVCLTLPADNVRRLVENYRVFERYFSFSLARTIKAVRQTADFQRPQPIGQSAVSREVYLTGKRVADIMNKDILFCAPYITVQAAAQMMTRRRVSSIVVTGNGLHPLGIMTDNDLRTKVLAAGLSPEVAVAGVMTQPVHTVSPEADAFEALLLMSHNGVSILVAVENDHMVGIISEHDLQMEAGSSPLQVIDEIRRTTSLDTLIDMRYKIDSVLEMMLRQGGPVKQLAALVTELNDRLTMRIIKLVEEEMERDGFGKPPVPYGWLAFGSEGRREQTLHTDQDNALFFAPKPDCNESECKDWFLKFAQRVVDNLVRSGIPECPGGIMASNPDWCQPEDLWLDKFLGWIKDPSPEPLLMASIFFDFRPIYTGTNFPYILEDQLLKAIRKSGLFLRFMAKNALINRPPLSLLKRFVVEKSGEHKNKFDLKQRGLTPVVDAARVLSLSLGIKTQNTLDRLAEINRIGIIDDGFYPDLREAYQFLVYLQLSRHLDALAQGEKPDNFINPASLSGLQRKMLKESFAVVRGLQETIEFRFKTNLVEI